MKIIVSDGIEASQENDVIVLRPAASEIIAAAVSVVEERHRGNEWDALDSAIGSLADALRAAGHGQDWEFYA